MLNYMRAELYRSFNRKYFWVYFGTMAALAFAVNLLGSANNLPGMNLSLLLETTLLVLVLPVYLIAGIIDMVTSEENKHSTMRNVITFGVSRDKIILSKLIVSVVLSFIGAIIVLSAFYGSGLLFFGMDSGVSQVLPKVAVRLATAVPLWIGALSLGTFLALSISNNTLYGFAHAGIFFLTSKILSLLSYLVSDKFVYINKYLITTRLTALSAPELPSSELWLSVVIGLAYTVVFTALSLWYFSRKEIK